MLLSLAMFLSATSTIMAKDTMNVNLIDIKPGAGRQEISHQLKSFGCTFQYKAQGGTNEQWSMTLAAEGKMLTCTVERPSGLSYLFFEEFKLRISGANLQEAVLDRKEGVPLSVEEYIVVQDENYVQQVDGKFNSQLTRIQVSGKRIPKKATTHVPEL